MSCLCDCVCVYLCLSVCLLCILFLSFVCSDPLVVWPAQDPRFWQATSQRDCSPVVIKLVPSGSAELGALRMLAPETALRVIPMLAVASNVCPGWHGIMMPRLTTLSHLLASFAECEDDSVGEAILFQA
jgi:hypothetical protein